MTQNFTFTDTSESLSTVLQRLIGNLSGKTITLRELMEAIGEQGLLLMCAIACLPFLIPVSIPGVSTVFGAAIVMISLAITLNRLPWLPRRILDRQMETARLVPALQKGVSIVSKLDRYMRPRLPAFTTGTVMARINGLAIMTAGVLLMMPLGFVPFSNTLPGVAI
ncbi:exopolysaccharide biosynthesis protein, partial [Agrobacterium rosae]